MNSLGHFEPGFVGRREELERLREYLVNPRPHIEIVHYAAPGGFGKTELLNQLLRVAANATEVVLLDASDHDGECDRLARRLDTTFSALGPGDVRAVVFVDELPQDAVGKFLRVLNIRDEEGSGRHSPLLVTAGRWRLPDHLRYRCATSGWVTSVDLPTLSMGESEDLLALLAPDIRERDFVVQECQGHPLSLVRAAAHAQAAGAALRSLPRKTLLELRPSTARRHAERLALVSLVPRAHDLLTDHVLGADAYPASVLAELPFIRKDVGSVSIHPLFRDPTLDILNTTAPETLGAVRERVVEWYAAAIERAGSYDARLEYSRDWAYLSRGRDSAFDAFHVDPDGSDVWYGTPELGSPELDEVRACLQAAPHEHETVRGALQRAVGGPGVEVFYRRSAEGPIADLVLWVRGDDVDREGELLRADPVLAHLNARGALRGAQIARLFLSFRPDASEVLETPSDALVARLGAEAFARADARTCLFVLHRGIGLEWAERRYFDRFDELDVERDDGSCSIVGYDFGRESAGTRMRRFAPRERDEDPITLTFEKLPRVDRADVVQALRVATDDARLNETVLAQRVARLRASADEASVPARTRQLLRDCAAALSISIGSRTGAELVQMTYFDAPHEKQRTIASRLHLSYGTYRRHLSRALDNLTIHVNARLAVVRVTEDAGERAGRG